MSYTWEVKSQDLKSVSLCRYTNLHHIESVTYFVYSSENSVRGYCTGHLEKNLKAIFMFPCPQS